MEIKSTTEGTRLTIAVSGRVDTVTAPELEAGLKFGDATCVVIDLANVPYMSSAGLRLLLAAHKQMLGKGGELLIANVQSTVREVLDITGFSDILNLT
ncbi:MAG: STAS domain-containing protein [Kiritimatiellae bacterium]|nr:STAS domain-containing protein [Kiritimatiellia bacterium]